MQRDLLALGPRCCSWGMSAGRSGSGTDVPPRVPARKRSGGQGWVGAEFGAADERAEVAAAVLELLAHWIHVGGEQGNIVSEGPSPPRRLTRAAGEHGCCRRRLALLLWQGKQGISWHRGRGRK
ncbi:hypothetical protein GQ55_5G385300 [Panicum hallii var. hallii]|uniref:Uncharacterized protein n=1 Tax=Panicum hallii var. hallii TaxID=1504633 RepID=A0A2T7DMW7_9POAL|nr:hypothetical protein GQ55_5G385300 [Panicum hallii var. hallii]